MRKLFFLMAAFLFFSGCAYNGAIKADFYAINETNTFTRLPLDVALVQPGSFKTRTFYDELNGFSVNIAMNPGLVNALQTTLASIFEKVRIVDSVATTRDADIIIIPEYEIRAVSKDHLSGNINYESRMVLTFKDPQSGQGAQYKQTSMIHFSPPPQAHAASFITGLSLFILSPVTIPWETQQIGKHAEGLLEKDIRGLMSAMADEIKSDGRLINFAVRLNEKRARKINTPAI